jgi:hypothetical protein
MAQGLVAAGTCTNPAGWLRKAIEEDYSPPKIGESHENREKKTQQAVRIVEEPVPDPEPVLPTVPDQEPIPDDEPGESTPEDDKDTENRETWDAVAEEVKECLPFGTDPNTLDGTKLLRLSDSAVIGVPDQRNCLHLERRLYREISQALKGVLGRHVDLQFLTIPVPKIATMT